MVSSRSVVLAALVANAMIAVLKFGGYLVTGSPSMLSETYHSISDTGNQVFLLVGLWYGHRGRTRVHPFGYGKAQFFYSFLVSVLLFGIAGWESARHGYAALVHGETGLLTGTVTFAGQTFPSVYVNYAVLLGGIAFEGWAFAKAHKAMSQQIDDHGWSGFVEAFSKTADVTTLTALTEDTVALLGLTLALVGIFLTRTTGNPVYDAAAAFTIGILLMCFALALAWENKRLLIGESLAEPEERRLRRVITSWDGVLGISDFRTVYFGPDDVLLTADVVFEADLDTEEIDAAISGIEDALRSVHDDVRKVYIEPEA